MKSNLPEPVHDVSLYLVDFALELFKVVRRGSMWSNDPELAHNHPIPPVEVQFRKVQCCRTSLNSFKRGRGSMWEDLTSSERFDNTELGKTQDTS